MNILIFVFSSVLLLTGGLYLLDYIDKRESNRSRKKRFEKKQSSSLEKVKYQAINFNSSLDHLKNILDMFSELSSDKNNLELKPFEGYIMPTSLFYFRAKFYVLVSESFEYRILITEDTLTIDDTNYKEDEVKKYLPYSLSLDELKGIYNECKAKNKEVVEERRRRSRVNNALAMLNK